MTVTSLCLPQAQLGVLPKTRASPVPRGPQRGTDGIGGCRIRPPTSPRSLQSAACPRCLFLSLISLAQELHSRLGRTSTPCGSMAPQVSCPRRGTPCATHTRTRSHPSRLLSVTSAFAEFTEFIKKNRYLHQRDQQRDVTEELREEFARICCLAPCPWVYCWLGHRVARAVSVPPVHTPAVKLLSAPEFSLAISPLDRAGCAKTPFPWAMLRHHIYAGAVQAFEKKTHSKCKHFRTYSHGTSTHEVSGCFLHKSRVKELHKEHSSLEHGGSLTARQHATRWTLSSRNIVKSQFRTLLPSYASYIV